MRLTNRSAHFNYQIFDTFEAGVVLDGAETKSLFLGQASLEEAYVKFIDGEAFLLNAHIHPYQFADNRDYDPTRTRRLLLHKNELLKIAQQAAEKGLTIVPLSCYNKHNRIKLEIALGKGKKKYDKRETLKKRESKRSIERTLKNQ